MVNIVHTFVICYNSNQMLMLNALLIESCTATHDALCVKHMSKEKMRHPGLTCSQLLLQGYLLTINSWSQFTHTTRTLNETSWSFNVGLPVANISRSAKSLELSGVTFRVFKRLTSPAAAEPSEDVLNTTSQNCWQKDRQLTSCKMSQSDVAVQC